MVDFRLLKTREVAARLGCSRQALRVKRMKGDGPPWVRLARNRVGYLESGLLEWIKSRTFTSIAEERHGRAVANVEFDKTTQQMRDLLSAGKSMRQIAVIMGLNVSTVSRRLNGTSAEIEQKKTSLAKELEILLGQVRAMAGLPAKTRSKKKEG